MEVTRRSLLTRPPPQTANPIPCIHPAGMGRSNRQRIATRSLSRIERAQPLHRRL